jgi:hypothetical protein
MILNVENRTITTEGSGLGLSLFWAYNPLTWPLAFSASILTLFYALKSDRGILPAPLAFLLLLSFSASVGEPFVWYLLPGLPSAFMCLTYVIAKIYAKSTNQLAAKSILLLYLVSNVIWSLFVDLPPYIQTLQLT